MDTDVEIVLVQFADNDVRIVGVFPATDISSIKLQKYGLYWKNKLDGVGWWSETWPIKDLKEL